MTTKQKIEEIVKSNMEITEGVIHLDKLVDQLYSLYQEGQLECHFNFGNKTCKGRLYIICSAHVNKIREDAEYFEPELLSTLKKVA